MPLTKDASGTALTTADRIDLAAATVHGPYATLAALQAAVPAAAGLAGQVARVGAAAPFVLYRCDGAAWLRQVPGDGIAGPYVMGLLGDSRLYASHITDGGTAGTTYPAQEVATTRDDKGANGIAYHLEAISGGAILCPRAANFAIAGQRSWEVAARADVAVAGMRAAGARGVLVLVGTNDRGAVGRTHLDTIASIAQIIASARSAGLRVHLVAELPRGDATFTAERFSGTNLAEHMAVRAALLAMHDGDGVVVADAWPTACDSASATADVIAGYTYDGLHPAGPMSQRVAAAIWASCAGLVRPYSWAPSGNADLWSLTNTGGAITLNPAMSGTGGTLGSGMTGTMATSWTGGPVSAGITCAASSVLVGGQPAQQFVLGGTSSTTSAFDLCRRDTSIGTNGLAIGGRVRMVACLDIEAGAAGLYEIDAYCASSPASARSGASAPTFTQTIMADGAMTGAVCITEPMTIPAGAASVRGGVRSYPRAAPVSANVRVRWAELVHVA